MATASSSFWSNFDRALRISGLPIRNNIQCSGDFLQAFLIDNWNSKNVVLLLDEFDELLATSDEIRNDFLRALRDLKQSSDRYVVRSVIAAGTYSILDLSPKAHYISPYNVSDCVQNAGFSIEETKALFDQFAEDEQYSIEDAVINDLWNKCNGLVLSCFSCIEIHIYEQTSGFGLSLRTFDSGKPRFAR
jgi:hypothetical protein